MKHRAPDKLAEAVAYLRAGGRPEAIDPDVLATAWREAGRGDVYRDIGHGWLMPHDVARGTVVLQRLAGVPWQARKRKGYSTPWHLHPVKRYDGPTDAPKHALPCGGRESVFVTTDGAVHRGLYWSGNYASASAETGDWLAVRCASKLADGRVHDVAG